mgnify:CR=1 FL=1
MNEVKGLTNEQFQVFKNLVKQIMEECNTTSLEIDKEDNRFIIYAVDRVELEDFSLEGVE